MEGEETNEISLKIVLSCLALPGLALRKKHYDEEGDGASCDSITPENFPETMSCDFNARKLKLQRLGFNCSKSHGSRDIIQELRKEKSNDTLSVMNGNMILVLTSFREGDVTKKRDKYRMNSILRASEPDTGAESTGAESIVAIPLTEKILEDALRWLKGNTDTGEASLANGQTERTLEELVTAYLDSLSKAIPAKSDCKTLMDFIHTHDWPDGSLEEMLEELKKKDMMRILWKRATSSGVSFTRIWQEKRKLWRTLSMVIIEPRPLIVPGLDLEMMWRQRKNIMKISHTMKRKLRQPSLFPSS